MLNFVYYGCVNFGNFYRLQSVHVHIKCLLCYKIFSWKQDITLSTPISDRVEHQVWMHNKSLNDIPINCNTTTSHTTLILTIVLSPISLLRPSNAVTVLSFVGPLTQHTNSVLFSLSTTFQSLTQSPVYKTKNLKPLRVSGY